MNKNYDCGDCKYLLENYNNTFTCKKTGKTFEDWDSACAQFKKLCACDTCMFSNTRVYELGEIDEIDYVCTLQNNKVMFEDTDPIRIKNSEFPECNIRLYEEK